MARVRSSRARIISSQRRAQAEPWQPAGQAEIRARAKQQGLPAKKHGQVPYAIVTKYETAHAGGR